MSTETNAPSRSQFSEAEDMFLGQLLAQGLKPCQIARRMDRAESSVYRRIQFLGLGPGQQQKTKRNCMCCQKEFLSDGPHNRLCTRCRSKDSGPF